MSSIRQRILSLSSKFKRNDHQAQATSVSSPPRSLELPTVNEPASSTGEPTSDKSHDHNLFGPGDGSNVQSITESAAEDADLLDLYVPEDRLELNEPEPIILGPTVAELRAAKARMRRPLYQRIPFEIWKRIFTLTTSIPYKDELSLDASAYSSMICDYGSFIGTLPTSAEQMQNYRERKQLVGVCKYWYSMGMELLWSHLLLRIPEKVKNLQYIYRILETRPELAQAVIRLTVQYSGDAYHTHDLLVQRLIRRLPNLRILSCPTALGTMGHFFRPNVLILTSHFHFIQAPPLLGGNFWINIRVLVFHHKMGRIIPSTEGRTEFPLLETLHVRDHDGNLLRYIGTYWSMPALRTLSLRQKDDNGRSDPDTILSILHASGKNLQKLELLVHPPGNSDVQILVEMKNLKTLYLIYNGGRWVNIIQAPILRRLGFCILHPTDRLSSSEVDLILDSNPTIEELDITKPVPRAQYKRRVPVSGQLCPTLADSNRWKRRGLRFCYKYSVIEDDSGSFAAMIRDAE